MSFVNEGSTDRIIRFVVGAALFVAVFTVLSGVAQIIAGVVGAILVLTSVVGFCPAYALFGIKTCKIK